MLIDYTEMARGVTISAFNTLLEMLVRPRRRESFETLYAFNTLLEMQYRVLESTNYSVVPNIFQYSIRDADLTGLTGGLGFGFFQYSIRDAADFDAVCIGLKFDFTFNTLLEMPAMRSL